MSIAEKLDGKYFYYTTFAQNKCELIHSGAPRPAVVRLRPAKTGPKRGASIQKSNDVRYATQ
jgi:hypothetical protein